MSRICYAVNHHRMEYYSENPPNFKIIPLNQYRQNQTELLHKMKSLICTDCHAILFGKSFCNSDMSHAEKPHPIPNIGRSNTYIVYTAVRGYKLKLFLKQFLKYS